MTSLRPLEVVLLVVVPAGLALAVFLAGFWVGRVTARPPEKQRDAEGG